MLLVSARPLLITNAKLQTNEQRVDELQKKAVDAPVINQQKVDELKKAIISGEYKVNPEKLAASIANFEFNLV